MNTFRTNARVVGVLFLFGFAGVFGPTILKPVLESPDYLTKIFENQNLVMLGAQCQAIMAFACAGIAIGLYPILKRHHQALALGAVGFRLIENIFQLIAALALLSLLTLSQAFEKADGFTASTFQITGDFLLSVRYWASQGLGQIGFGLGALMYYYVFYRSKLIPRWLSVWGLIAITLHLVEVLIAMFMQVDSFSVTPLLLMSVPIGLQELTLAAWLLIKGFNPAAITFGIDKQEKI